MPLSNFEFLRNRLLAQAGILPAIKSQRSIASLYKSEWDTEFELLCRNRLVMGALRYGPMQAKGMKKFDRTAGIKKRINQYIETGNKETLVDIANLAMLEFREGNHKKSHWESLNGDHCCI